MAELPIQTLIAKGLSNSKRIRSIEANTEANVNVSKEIVKALSGLDALKPSGGSNGGNGKSSSDDSSSKEDLAEAVNTGFSEGVGDIKQGFANLGAGLGPLRIVVDFVKNVGEKLGALFGIFKGLGKVLFSIPKGLFGFFRGRKKKDKIDKKNVLAQKKSTGKLTKMFGLLKPVVLLGFIGAISYGIIKLYNWMARRGLGDYFTQLGRNISDSILDFRIMLAEAPWFGDSDEAAKLQEEKVVRAVERLDRDIFTVRQGEKETDEDFEARKLKMVADGNAILDANGKAILAGVAKYDAIVNQLTGKVDIKQLDKILNSENIFTADKDTGLSVDPTGRTDYARQNITKQDISKGTSEGTEKTIKTTRSFDRALRESGVSTVDTMALKGASFSEQHIGDDGTFRTNRVIKDPRNGEPFTLAEFTNYLNDTAVNEMGGKPMSEADVRTGLARHPNLMISQDKNSNIEYVTLAKTSREKKTKDGTKMVDANVDDYSGSDFATDIGHYYPGLVLDALALVTDTVSLPFGGRYGSTANLMGSSDGTFRYGFTGDKDIGYSEDSDQIAAELLSADALRRILETNELTGEIGGNITMGGSMFGNDGRLYSFGESEFLRDVKNINRFNAKYEGVDPTDPFRRRPRKRREYYEDLADIQISGERLLALQNQDKVRDAGIGDNIMTNVVQSVNETFNTFGNLDAEGGGFDYIKEHSISENRYGNLID